MKGIAVALVAVLAVVALMTVPSKAAVTCTAVNRALAPCAPYLRSGGTPTAQCCGGVRNLVSMAATKADRQAACNCVKQAAARFPDIREGDAAALPTKCGVRTTVPISRNVDCSKYGSVCVCVCVCVCNFVYM
ncbi:hypothetical protein NMG60_11006465 [Bertholletia excelsa]